MPDYIVTFTPHLPVTADSPQKAFQRAVYESGHWEAVEVDAMLQGPTLPPVVFGEEAYDSWINAVQQCVAGEWCVSLELADGTRRDVVIRGVGYGGDGQVLGIAVVPWSETYPETGADVPPEWLNITEFRRIRVY